MKRHHFTSLCAIAVLLIGIVVVALRANSPEEAAHSHEELQALQQRRAERYLEPKQARASPTPSTMHDFAAMKERMLKEFPNLRTDPQIPDEHNPMYLLNELAMEVVDSAGPFRSELEGLMRSDHPWDLAQAQALLEKYGSVVDRLEKIGSMNVQGSNRFASVVERTKHDDALMLFLDLLRLKEWVHEQNGDIRVGVGHMVRFAGVGLPNVILNSKGSTIRHTRMVESHILAAAGNPMDLELYDSMGRHAAYNANVLNWHQPDWGRTLNNKLLVDALRDQWEGHFSMILQSEISMDTDEGAVRAYSAQCSQMIEELENKSLSEFYNARPPKLLNDSNLTPEQMMWAQERSLQSRENLRSIMIHATHQNLKTAAFHFHRNFEVGVSFSESASNLQLQFKNPVTGKPMTYDPETRILRYQDPIEGQTHVGILLWPPGKGSLTVPGRLLLPNK